MCILTATRGGELFQDLISQLAGGKRVQDCRAFSYAFDGVQGDADFVAAVFSLNRT